MQDWGPSAYQQAAKWIDDGNLVELVEHMGHGHPICEVSSLMLWSFKSHLHILCKVQDSLLVFFLVWSQSIGVWIFLFWVYSLACTAEPVSLKLSTYDLHDTLCAWYLYLLPCVLCPLGVMVGYCAISLDLVGGKLWKSIEWDRRFWRQEKVFKHM